MLIIKFISLLFLISFSIANENIVKIIATANVMGEIDPCGWPKNPLGGLARKATILDKISETYNDAYIVDAGNLFFKDDILDPGISTESAIINADIIIKSLNRMGLTVFSPGVKDFAAGADFILSAEKRSDFTFISANIHDKNNQLLFEPYIIEQKNGLNIAFIGLSSVFNNDNITVTPPIEALNNIMDEIVAKSDIRVLLFSSENKDLDLLQSDVGLDLTLIIRSKDKARSSNGGPDIPVYSVGDKGKLIYQFDLENNESQAPYIDIAWCNTTISTYEKRLEKMKKGNMLTDLHAMFKDDPATLKRIIKYESKIKEAKQRLDKAINKITFNKIEASRSIDGRIDILQIVDKGKLELKKISTPNLNLNGNKQHQHRHMHDHDGDGVPDH